MNVMNIFFTNMHHMGDIGLSQKRKCLLNGPKPTGLYLHTRTGQCLDVGFPDIVITLDMTMILQL